MQVLQISKSPRVTSILFSRTSSNEVMHEMITEHLKQGLYYAQGKRQSTGENIRDVLSSFLAGAFGRDSKS